MPNQTTKPLLIGACVLAMSLTAFSGSQGFFMTSRLPAKVTEINIGESAQLPIYAYTAEYVDKYYDREHYPELEEEFTHTEVKVGVTNYRIIPEEEASRRFSVEGIEVVEISGFKANTNGDAYINCRAYVVDSNGYEHPESYITDGSIEDDRPICSFYLPGDTNSSPEQDPVGSIDYEEKSYDTFRIPVGVELSHLSIRLDGAGIGHSRRQDIRIPLR